MELWWIAPAIIGLYLLLTLVLGWLARRKLTPSLDDFFLYGRKARFPILYLTVVATYHSAFAFLGAAGFFYSHGIGFWEAGGWVILVGIITYVMGPRIWALGKKFGYITPADLLADFYASDTVRILTAAVSVLSTVFYIQAQSMGLGYILVGATGNRISFPLATALFLVVSLVYIAIGGLRAIYWTDAVQGVWMYAAVWIGALYLTRKLFGGPATLFQTLASERPELLTLPGPLGFFTYPMWGSLMILLSFGIILQPHLFIRYYTASDATTLKWLGATVPLYLISLFIPVGLVGLGGALAMPGLSEPDQIFPQMLATHAPVWLTGVILAGAAAAAMSTLDSILHANMTVFTRDIYQRFLRPQASEVECIRISRLILVSLVGVGYVLSVRHFDFLVVLVTHASAVAIQLLPAVVSALVPARLVLTSRGVTAGLVTGFLVLIITLFWYPHPLQLHGGIWALFGNTVLAVAVSWANRGAMPQGALRIHEVLEEFVYGKS